MAIIHEKLLDSHTMTAYLLFMMTMQIKLKWQIRPLLQEFIHKLFHMFVTEMYRKKAVHHIEFINITV